MCAFFYVLLTVHLSIIILVINQLDAQILRCVIPAVCRKINGEVNISHENTFHKSILPYHHSCVCMTDIYLTIDAQHFLFYNKFISCLYMFLAHVLETCGGMK